MKKRILKLRIEVKTLVIALLLGVAGITDGYCVRFSAVCPSGISLYYNITDNVNHYVELTYPNHHEDDGYWEDYELYGNDAIIIPETVEYNGITYTVVSVGDHAFFQCSGSHTLFIPNTITSIAEYGFSQSGIYGALDIPNSVTIIGDYAFAGDNNLTGSLIIPNSVTTIGFCAFSGCTGFSGNLFIPNSVSYIGQNAFKDCSEWDQIVVESGNMSYDSRGNCNAIIDTNTNELIMGCMNTNIPETVTSIGDYAFYQCNGLASVNFSNSVNSIGNYAFYGCIGLDSVDIPNSILSIGNSAFNGCVGLTSINLGDSVITIGNSAFYMCTGLTSISIPNTVTSIGSAAFCGCIGLTSIQIPNSVISIGNSAFGGCHGLISVIIGKSVTSLMYAFYDCASLSSVIILATSVPRVWSHAFEGTSLDLTIYVPYETIDEYKRIWFTYISKIQPMVYKTIPAYSEGSSNWCFIALPLADSIAPTAVDNMITETEYDLYQFNPSGENGEWENYKVDSFNIVNGQGYLYANAREVNVIFKGEFNEDETKEVSLSYNTTSAGWNLLGNPFPCNAYINKEYYVMNEDGTAINPVAVPASMPIPPCTGVFVKAETEGETVVFSRASGTQK